MKYYLADTDPLPKIIFAHGYGSENYNINFIKNPRVFEITFIERGDMTVFDREENKQAKHGANNPIAFYPQKSIIVFHHDRAVRFECRGAYHHHYTVGLSFASPPRAADESELHGIHPGPTQALIPEALPPSSEASLRCETIIKQLSRDFSSATPNRMMTLYAGLFSLLAEMTSAISESFCDVAGEKKNNPYIRRAREYISQNLASKIAVEDVAKAAGVSYGYLSSIFSAATGMTMIDYINTEKLEAVKKLITTRKITLAEAGAAVGIDDEKYLSRIFKKHSGITVSEYRRLHAYID